MLSKPESLIMLSNLNHLNFILALLKLDGISVRQIGKHKCQVLFIIDNSWYETFQKVYVINDSYF